MAKVIKMDTNMAFKSKFSGQLTKESNFHTVDEYRQLVSRQHIKLQHQEWPITSFGRSVYQQLRKIEMNTLQATGQTTQKIRNHVYFELTKKPILDKFPIMPSAESKVKFLKEKYFDEISFEYTKIYRKLQRIQLDIERTTLQEVCISKESDVHIYFKSAEEQFEFLRDFSQPLCNTILAELIAKRKESHWWNSIGGVRIGRKIHLYDFALEYDDVHEHLLFIDSLSGIFEFVVEAVNDFNNDTYERVRLGLPKNQRRNVNQILGTMIASMESFTTQAEFQPPIVPILTAHARRMKMSILKQFYTSGYLNPELARGLITDISLRFSYLYEGSPICKPIVVFNNEFAVCLKSIYATDATKLDICKFLALQLLKDKEHLYQRAKDMIHNDQLQGDGGTFKLLIKSITNQITERLAPMTKMINKALYASIALDIFNIITNFVSLYRGDNVVRAMNIVSLLANLIRLAMTICVAVKVDWNGELEQITTDLFYKWLIVKVEGDEQFSSYLDDETREVINLIRVEDEKNPTTSWEYMKSLVQGTKNSTEKQHVMEAFDEKFYGGVVELVCHDDYTKYAKVLAEDWSERQREEFYRLIRGTVETKDNREVLNTKTCPRLFFNELSKASSVGFTSEAGYNHWVSCDNNNVKRYWRTTYVGEVEQLDIDELRKTLDSALALPEHLDFRVLAARVKPEKLQGVNVQKWVSMGINGVLTTLALGMCVYACKQTDAKGNVERLNNNTAAALIQFGSLKNTFKSMYNDIDDLIREIKDVCDNSLQTEQEQMIAKTLAANELLNKYLALPDVTFHAVPNLLNKFQDSLKWCEKMMTTKIQTTPEINRAFRILSASCTACQQKLIGIQGELAGSCPKQEAVLVWIYGANGAGKSHFVNNKLSEYMKTRFDTKPVYPISFGGQPEFFPETYAGQENCVFDEFLQSRKDPMLPHLNNLTSNMAMNLPGAYKKINPCNIKLLTLLSNTENMLDSKKMEEFTSHGLSAIHSKLRKFRFVNTLDTRPNTEVDRELVETREDYSHLSIERVWHTTSGVEIQPPKSYSVDEFLAYIGDEYESNIQRYNGFLQKRDISIPKINIEDYDHLNVLKKLYSVSDKLQGAPTGHFYTMMVYGPPRAGKGLLVHKLASKLQQVTNYEIITVSSLNVKSIKIDYPAIVVANDCTDDEGSYMAFFDSIPNKSILLVTSNLVVKKTGWFNGAKMKYNWNYAPDYTTWITRSLQGLNHTCWQVFNDKATKTAVERPGFARRLGVTGPVVYGGKANVVPEGAGKFYEAREGQVYIDNVKGEIVTESMIYSEIYRGWINFNRNYGEVEVKKATNTAAVNEHVSQWPKVVIKSDTPHTLQALLNSNFKLIKAEVRATQYLKTRNTPMTLNELNKLEGDYIFVDDKVIAKFQATVEVFRVPEGDITHSDIRDLALRTYRSLRDASEQFDVIVDCGEVYIGGNGGEVLYSSPYQEEFEVNTLEFKIIGEQPNIKYLITDNDKLSFTLDKEQICKIQLSGLQNLITSVELTYSQQLQFLNLVKEIYKRPEFKQVHKRIELQQMAKQILVEKNLKSISWWETFKASPWYMVFKVLGGIVTAATAITVIWCAFSGFKSSGVVQQTNINGNPYKIEVSDKDVVITKDTSNNLTDLEVQSLISEVSPAYLQSYEPKTSKIVPRRVAIKTEKLQYVNDFKKTTALPAVRMRLGNDIMQSQPDIKEKLHTAYTVGPAKRIFQYDTIEGVRNKVSKNIIAMRAHGDEGVQKSYALGIKGHYFLSNAHTCKNSYVEVMDDKGTYATQKIWEDTLNDFALHRIISKNHESFKDISKNFVSERNAPSVDKVFMLRQTTIDNNRIEIIVNGTSKYLNKYDIFDSDANAFISGSAYRVVYYNHAGFKSMPGHCGLPYISTDPRLNGQCIVGLHTAGTNEYATSFSVTTEMLESMFSVAGQVFNEPEMTQGEFTTYKEVTLPAVTGGELIEYNNFMVHEELYNFIDVKSTPEIKVPEIFENSQWLTSYGSLEAGTCSYHSPKHRFTKAPWAEEMVTPLTVDNSILALPDIRLKDSSKLILDQYAMPSLIHTQLSYHNEPIPLTETQQQLLHHATTLVAAEYKSIYGSSIPKLNLDQAINSIHDINSEHYNCLPDLEMDASTGYFVTTRFNCPKKAQLFDKTSLDGQRNRYKFNNTPAAQYVKESVEAFIMFADNDKVLLDIGKVALKAEVLKIEKVETGMTRVFSPRGIVSTIIERMMFGPFMGKIKRHRDVGFCQVGIDPLRDFTQLYHRFLNVGRVAIALDFKRWDKHILPDLVEQAFMVIYKCMERPTTSAENIIYNTQIFKIIRAISQTFTCELVFADRTLLVRTVGMPSGTVLTSVINSIINDLIYKTFVLNELSRVGNECCVPDVQDLFLKKMDRVHYGDDLVIVVPHALEKLISPTVYQEFVKEWFSIESTGPTKTGDKVEYVPINQVEFLSMKMELAPESGHLIIPQLKINSITKQLYFWSNYRAEEIANGIITILEFACAHPKEVYDMFYDDCNTILKYCEEHHYSYKKPILYDYNTQRDIQLRKVDPSYGRRGPKETQKRFNKLSKDNSLCINQQWVIKEKHIPVINKFQNDPHTFPTNSGEHLQGLKSIAMNKCLMPGSYNNKMEHSISQVLIREWTKLAKRVASELKISRIAILLRTIDSSMILGVTETHYRYMRRSDGLVYFKSLVFEEMVTQYGFAVVAGYLTSQLVDYDLEEDIVYLTYCDEKLQSDDTPHSMPQTLPTIPQVVTNQEAPAPMKIVQVGGVPAMFGHMSGVQQNFMTAALQHYYQVGANIPINPDTAVGTLIFSYSYTGLANNWVKAWKDLHDIYGGGMDVKIRLIGASTYIGEIYVGFYYGEKLTKEITKEDLIQFNCSVLGMGNIQEVEFTFNPTHPYRYWFETSSTAMNAPDPNIRLVALLGTPLRNSFPTPGIEVYLEIFSKPSRDFYVMRPKLPVAPKTKGNEILQTLNNKTIQEVFKDILEEKTSTSNYHLLLNSASINTETCGESVVTFKPRLLDLVSPSDVVLNRPVSYRSANEMSKFGEFQMPMALQFFEPEGEHQGESYCWMGVSGVKVYGSIPSGPWKVMEGFAERFQFGSSIDGVTGFDWQNSQVKNVFQNDIPGTRWAGIHFNKQQPIATNIKFYTEQRYEWRTTNLQELEAKVYQNGDKFGIVVYYSVIVKSQNAVSIGDRDEYHEKLVQRVLKNEVDAHVMDINISDSNVMWTRLDENVTVKSLTGGYRDLIITDHDVIDQNSTLLRQPAYLESYLTKSLKRYLRAASSQPFVDMELFDPITGLVAASIRYSRDVNKLLIRASELYGISTNVADLIVKNVGENQYATQIRTTGLEFRSLQTFNPDQLQGAALAGQMIAGGAQGIGAGLQGVGNYMQTQQKFKIQKEQFNKMLSQNYDLFSLGQENWMMNNRLDRETLNQRLQGQQSHELDMQNNSFANTMALFGQRATTSVNQSFSPSNSVAPPAYTPKVERIKPDDIGSVTKSPLRWEEKQFNHLEDQDLPYKKDVYAEKSNVDKSSIPQGTGASVATLSTPERISVAHDVNTISKAAAAGVPTGLKSSHVANNTSFQGTPQRNRDAPSPNVQL